VHLDQPVVVGDGAVDDEEHEVVLGRPMEVDPEEAAAREQALDVLAAQMQLADLLLMHDVAGRGAASARLAARRLDRHRTIVVPRAAPYPQSRSSRCFVVATSPTSLPRELERFAPARWSWTTYRHLRRRRLSA
jgi:hypothetical protein